MNSLSLDNVTKTFGGVAAVADLSLTVEPGRVTGLIGPNGAGKSTVVNLVTGMLKVTSGEVRFDGRSITHVSPQAVARAGVARTFQNIRLLKEATVLDNIVIGLHRHETTSLLANLIGLPAVWREKADFEKRALALLDRFGMLRYRDYPAGSLSYGHQRRVEIMRALATSPKVVLLDEPVAGMNDVEADGLGSIFQSLADDGVAVLLIEHNVRFVRSLCHRVYVINSGKLIAFGTADEVCRAPDVIEAYLGA